MSYKLPWLITAMAFVAAIGLTSCPAEAGTVGVHLGTWHSSPHYNDTNPGLYYRADNGFTAGGYYNSERKPSVYAAWTLSHTFAQGEVSVTFGAITGYRLARVLPLAVPSLKLNLTPNSGVRISWIPRISPKQDTHALHVSYEFSF